MNGTINLKKLSTKMLDAISTLNTNVSNLQTSIPSQIKTNNRQMLATVEQNAEAVSRAYAAGEYLAVNGKLYKALNDIAQGDALQENVNIEWVLLGDEVSNLRGSLKSGAFGGIVNDFNTSEAGHVLDGRLGPQIKSKMDLVDNLATRVAAIEAHDYGKTLYAYKRQKLTIGAYNNLASITIPANSGSWLILGNVTATTAAEIILLAQIQYSPNNNTRTMTARTKVNSGNGVCTWGYVDSYTQPRTATIQTYGYTNPGWDYQVAGQIQAWRVR